MNLVIPAVTLRAHDGSVDETLTRAYARRFADWSSTAIPLLCGATGRGAELTATQREVVFSAWHEQLPERRIMLTAWSVDEGVRLVSAGHSTVVPLSAGGSDDPLVVARHLVREIGSSAILYSHPRFGWLSPEALTELRDASALPAGLKLSKYTFAEVESARGAIGDGVEIWHGTARDPAASLAAGATGIVAACLAALPAVCPDTVADLHLLAWRQLRTLDGLPDRTSRYRWLEAQVRRLVG